MRTSPAIESNAAEIRCNGGLVVFLNRADQTVRPRLDLAPLGRRFAFLNYSERIPKSPSASELFQSLTQQCRQLDPKIGLGLDVYCVTDDRDPESLFFFLRLLNEISENERFDNQQIRAHCFAVVRFVDSTPWKAVFAELKGYGRIQGGGIYLVSNQFGSIVLDRLGSYPVLARVVQLFATTGRSRFDWVNSFTARHRSDEFGMYIALLESYTCPQLRLAAEYLLEHTLFLHLSPVFSDHVIHCLSIHATRYRSDAIEYWLMAAARKSRNLPQLSEQLMTAVNDADAESLLTSLDVEVRRSLAYCTHLLKPQSESFHDLEAVFPVFTDATVVSAASEAVLSLLELFPMPIHLFFSCKRPSVLHERILDWRADACEMLSDVIRRAFYNWAAQSHHRWLPANGSTTATKSALSSVCGLSSRDVSSPKDTTAHISCHVHPLLTQDARDEICNGAELIQYMNLLAIG